MVTYLADSKTLLDNEPSVYAVTPNDCTGKGAKSLMKRILREAAGLNGQIAQLFGFVYV